MKGLSTKLQYMGMSGWVGIYSNEMSEIMIRILLEGLFMTPLLPLCTLPYITLFMT